MMKSIFLSYGELLIDKIYDANNNLIKIDGGDTNMNVIYHLALMGEQCYAIGIVGDDEHTELAVSSLSKVGVNTEYVKRVNKPTNVVYQYLPDKITADNSVTFSCTHPGTDIPSWVAPGKKLSMKIPQALKDIDNRFILVLEDMEPVNLEFMNSINNKKVALDIDVRLISSLERLDKRYIQKFIGNVDICQVNEGILEVLLRKLSLTNVKEFYELFHFELMIITQGKRGAVFFYTDSLGETHQIEKKTIKLVDPSDPSGAGDAFLSVFLKIYKKYISENKSIDFEFIHRGFNLANLFSATIIQGIGSRGTDTNVVSNWFDQVKKRGYMDELKLL